MNVKVELKNGYFKSNLCLKDRLIDTAYKEFISKDFTYKKTYLQKKYNYGFDRYSYLGQKDSSNQYAEDLLHSFVISEFSDPKTFPKEFQPFLKHQWTYLTDKIKQVELKILESLNIDNKKDIIRFHEQYIGYMMSMNYYPANINNEAKKYRLSKHKDVSLITVFPFGISKGLFLIDEHNQEVAVEASHNLIAFPGYLMECLTYGKIKGIEHSVKFNPKNKDKRFD
ncbi:MAG: hypothetical protein CMC95_05640 [Flavobacteriales bacterium]|nr:hypothetical protein [Flavobacteriales bacterium]